MMKRIVFIILFILLLLFVVFVFFSRKHLTAQTAVVPTPNYSNYNAVFLTNGQVYFGLIKSITSDLIIITDVYYLKTVANGNTKNTTDSSLQLALIKLGKEILAPKDTMSINRANIQFWEELQESSQIVQAIKAYKNQK